MGDWMRDVGIVKGLHDAGTTLVHCCQGILKAHVAEGQQGSTSHPDACSARLAAAVEELRVLLQEVPQPLLALVPAGHRSVEASTGDAAARSASRLLQLPDDLLHRVGRLVGKESRLLCSRLRDAYGPPGHTVRQPLAGFEVEVNTGFNECPGYSTSYRDMQACVLQRACQRHGSPFTLQAITSCSVRWPGWAAQVLRLELSGSYTPDAAALRLVQQALPGLQQLAFAPAPSLGDYWDVVQQKGPSRETYRDLPRFEHLTQLRMLCSSHTFVAAKLASSGIIPANYEPLSIAPNLRSLHLDLRFVHITPDNLRPALQPLAQLTHLELVCSPARSVAGYVLYWEGVNAALLSLATRLQSLVFLTPAPHLGQGLMAMTRLTQLGWCTGYDMGEEQVLPTHDWLQAPNVQQLVLGTARREGGWIEPGTAAALAQGIDSSAVPRPALKSLVLPTVQVDTPEEDLPVLRRVVGALAARCPGLTALRLGCGLSDEDLPQGYTYAGSLAAIAEVHWLRPVARLQHLRQLVLTLSSHELDTLACLAGLPLLAELWLTVSLPSLLDSPLEARLEHDPQHQPGSELAQLASLEVLAVRTHECSSVFVHCMLAAVARLPRLRVLDLSSAWPFTAHSEAWRPLLTKTTLPPALREVRLTTPSRAWAPRLQEHGRTLELLTQLLPPEVVVSVCAFTGACGVVDFVERVWGPRPAVLTDTSIPWTQ